MVMVGGYGKMGAPHSLLAALNKHNAKNLTVVCSIAGCACQGSAIQGLLEQKKVKRLITSNVGENPLVLDQFKKGELEVSLVAMGNLIEKCRSGGYGIPAFYTRVGLGTFLEEGGVPIKLGKDGKTILQVNLAKEKRMFHGQDYLMEKTLLGDYSFIKAWKADTKGNAILKLANRNCNPDLAIAGKICIVEADEIVEAGTFDGDDIHVAGIFVHKVVKSAGCMHQGKPAEGKSCVDPLGFGEARKNREMMLKRAAKEIQTGSYVVLGPGLSKKVEEFAPRVDCTYVCPETGIFGAQRTKGCGEVKCGAELLDGCLHPVQLAKNAAITKTSDAFAGLRGNHLDLIVVDGFQVSQEGDLANLECGDRVLPSPGVLIDLAATNTPLVALMEMGPITKPNLVKQCTYRLTGRRCVNKLITDIAVFEYHNGDLTLTELAPNVTIDQVKSRTPCQFKVATQIGNMIAA
jgi:3-oxoacid CoA-transferase